MPIFTKISNYFQNLFGSNNGACAKLQAGGSIYMPELTPVPTPETLISSKNFNIFDSELTFNPSSSMLNNQIFNFTPMNFDMFTFRGFDEVSLNSEKKKDAIYDIEFWKDQGYNEEKGIALAKKAKSRTRGASQHQCAAYVRRAINRTFYSNEKGEHYTSFKKACIVGKEFLANDKNFKKINVDMSKIQPEDIPAGAIVIYPSRGYSSHSAGHIEISDGKGRGISDFTSKSLCQNNGRRKNPAEIWIPV